MIRNLPYFYLFCSDQTNGFIICYFRHNNKRFGKKYKPQNTKIYDTCSVCEKNACTTASHANFLQVKPIEKAPQYRLFEIASFQLPTLWSIN